MLSDGAGWAARGRVRLLAALVGAEVLLAAAHVIFTWPRRGTYPGSVVRLVHVDREANLPTWFSSTQLALLALVFAAVFVLDRLRHGRRRAAGVYLACAAAALFMSADEAATIHERIGDLVGHLGRVAPEGSLWRDLARFPSYYWALVYVPIAAPLGVAVAVFLWRELRGARVLAVGAIALFFAGAVGLDFLEGLYGDSAHRRLAVGGALLDVFLAEELCEMGGVTMMLAALTHRAVALLAELAPPARAQP